MITLQVQQLCCKRDTCIFYVDIVMIGALPTTFDGDRWMELSLWKQTVFHSSLGIGGRVSRMFQENPQISRNGREWDIRESPPLPFE
jgi:hypothetical protein